MLLGNGNGTFQTTQMFPTTGIVSSVALADVNGDGRPDLVVVSAGQLGVLLNADNGSYTGPVYTVQSTATFVQSIDRTTPTGPLTNASTVTYTVTFSEPVTGIVPSDFQVVVTGTVGTTLTQLTPVSTSVYTVTISGITGDGALGLNLVDNGTVVGQVYTIDNVAPFVESIDRTTPMGSVANPTSVTYTVTFSEPVTGVTPNDFEVALIDTATGTVTQVIPINSAVYTVTVSGISGNGTVGLNLVDNGSIYDLAGNRLTQQNAPAGFKTLGQFWRLE